MSLSHCIERVTAQDPDRHLVLQGFPEAVQARLYPLYALNLEIGRAAWVSREPLVCEMRLQWWADALERLGAGGGAKGHPVLEACGFLSGEAALCAQIAGIVAARSWDVWSEPFEEDDALFAHLEATGGALMAVAAQLCGAAGDPEPVRQFGTASALASWFRAVPELEARGRWPLPEGNEAAVRRLAARGTSLLAQARAARGQVAKAALPALLSGWQTDGILDLVRREPGRVAAGQLVVPDYKRRGSLAFRALTGRW
ncbi:squalene/phytoene synthase family protein [Falsigemmobacter faecalis]|nr:squalene/phytoene synthase family protein [Falsigemmobacter faecalis]